MNLCTNAGHAMGEKGGVFELSLGNVELRIGPGVRKISKMTVSDTGCGITPEVL